MDQQNYRAKEKVSKKILKKEYYKNISKIFQILLTFLSKCNIYNTKKTQKMEELSWQ